MIPGTSGPPPPASRRESGPITNADAIRASIRQVFENPASKPLPRIPSGAILYELTRTLGGSPSMLIQLNTSDDRPIYAQIVDQVKFAIAARAVRPRDLVPSVRELSKRLVV